MGAPLILGCLPYVVRKAPVVLVAALGGALLGRARFDEGWARWAAQTRPVRALVGPWIMGHASDLGLAIATAAFVDLAQSESTRRTRLAWQAVATGVLVGLEILQAPLGFGTFDPVDVVMLLLGALVVVAPSETARARRTLV